MTKVRNICMIAVIIITAMSVIVSADDNNNSQIMQPSADMGNQTVVKTLYAGHNVNVGTVEVSYDCQNISITYNMSENWTLSETHLEVASSFEDIPTTKSGNPIIGHFTYKNDSIFLGTTNYTYVVPINDINGTVNGTIYIAAHAEVLDNDSGNEEGAWAEGTDFPGGNWATYFTFEVSQCDENSDNVDNGNDGSIGEETGDNGTGNNGTDDNVDDGTGDNETGDSGTGDSGTDDNVDDGTGDNETGDSGTGNSGTDDNVDDGADTETKKSSGSSGSGRKVTIPAVTSTEDDNTYMSFDVQEEEQPPMMSMPEPVYVDEDQGTLATIMEKGRNFLWVIIAMLLTGIWIMSGYGLTFH